MKWFIVVSHFFVANPLYKTPREVCSLNSHYDIIDSTEINESYVARTNYLPQNIYDNYAEIIAGPITKTYKWLEEVGKDDKGKAITIKREHKISDCWFDYYKVGFRKMVGSASERTLSGAIMPPNTSHIFSLITTTFQEERICIEFSGLTASLVLDFFLKTLGVANLTDNRIQAFPLGIDDKYISNLFVRTLQLNCLNKYYAPLWERNWQAVYKQDSWSKNDNRLKPFNTLTPEWQWATPLRNWYERRQALVEIDVIAAMALGLTLDELILIYNVQFPVLQQNEDDTWYDTKGNIAFTCSKGLTGVGVDRPVWETIRDLKAGETYEHTIEKSELYRGKKVTYYAPFDKCDRVEDYKVAWEHFEKVFNHKN